jgi:cytochrome P450
MTSPEPAVDRTPPDQPADLVYNPYAFAVHEDPYALYRRMRDEAPAYWNDELEFWALSRFADVEAAFKDHETFSSALGVALESRRQPGALPMMITMDPPEHTVLRKLVSRVFTPRKVAAMEDETRRIVGGYLDGIVDAGACDLVADLTGPFPMDVISAVLGVPASERGHLREQADLILVREDGVLELPRAAMEGFGALVTYFAEDLPRRRRGEGDGLITDLAGLEVEGRRLSDDEVLAFCLLLIIAGHETTTKLVANAVELLSRHPDQRDLLVEDPSLAPPCVEEVLRFHTSTQYMHRTLTRDVERHGCLMRAGDSVLLMIGAANHDERELGPTADRFDIRRDPPRQIASFGFGAHYCLGAGLARMEARVALEELHRRIPDYEVDHDAKVRFHSGNVTGWSSLPVTFTARQPAAR